MKLRLHLAACGLFALAGAAHAGNGVPHAVGGVPMSAGDDIVSVAKEAGSFGTLLAAAKAAGLVEALRGEGPITVLAPTDEAFAKLGDDAIADLLRPENKARLAAILTYHVIPGRILANDAIRAARAETLQGERVEFAIRGGRLTAGDANVVANDIEASNGVIHVIDSVLIPNDLPGATPRGRLVIGVYTEAPSRALAKQLGIDRHGSLLVTRLTDGGTAGKAGLEQYDVIVGIDGHPATDDQLKRAKEQRGYEGLLRLDIVRGGRNLHLDVPVGIERH